MIKEEQALERAVKVGIQLSQLYELKNLTKGQYDVVRLMNELGESWAYVPAVKMLGPLDDERRVDVELKYVEIQIFNDSLWRAVYPQVWQVRSFWLNYIQKEAKRKSSIIKIPPVTAGY